MAQYQIPTKDKRFIQVNKGDIFGNLFATWNLDFDSLKGKVRVSTGSVIKIDSGDDTDLGLPLAFVRSSAGTADQWWVLTAGTGSTGALFKSAGTSPVGSWTQDAIATGDGTPTDLTRVSSDMVEFNGALIVSTSTDLHRLASASWDQSWWDTTLAQAAMTASIPHPLWVSKKTNLLLIGDGNKLHTINTSNNVNTSRVILSSEYQIIFIRSSYDGTWIGARNTLNREAQVFYWDEYSENYNRPYGVKSDMIFAGVFKNEILYIVNGEGQLMKFNGSGFDEVAVFPNFKDKYRRLDDGNTIIRSIHKNGMEIIDDKISILICSLMNNAIADTLDNFPSGIWTYDENEGLRHKFSLSQYDGTEIDYGSFVFSSVGALKSTITNSGLYLAGAVIFTNSSSTINAIFYTDTNDSLNKRGHFITSIFEASSFEDIFKDILLTFKRFRNSGDRIIIKYRNIKNPNYPIHAGGTWSDTDTFTSTDNLANVAVGDEVMIIRGRGAGATAHISSITYSAPTYTVNLDEAITNASGTIRVIIGDWTKAATISTQSIERQSFDLDVPGTFIQLKIELRSVPDGTANYGDSPELEKIVVNSSPEFQI